MYFSRQVIFTFVVIAGCSDPSVQNPNPMPPNHPVAAPTLDSLSIDLVGWESQERNEAMAIWSDDDGDALAINLFTEPPDLPTPRAGAEALRELFRNQAIASGNGGIVEVDAITIHGVRCVKIILKSRQQPTGFLYQGSFIIPRRDFSFVVRIQCSERRITGMRESAIMLIELPDPEFEEFPADAKPHPLFPKAQPIGKIKGWFKDPYDSKYDGSALYNLADQAKYDAKFPDHPLSRTRRKLKRVIDSLDFGPAIADAAEFNGPL